MVHRVFSFINQDFVVLESQIPISYGLDIVYSFESSYINRRLLLGKQNLYSIILSG